MSSKQERFAAGIRRAQATSILARVDSYVGDGSGDVYCIHAATGEKIRAGIGIPNVTLTQFQAVILGRTDGSGLSHNTGYTVTAFPPAALRNASNIAPTSRSSSQTAPTVIFNNPQALTLAPNGVGLVSIFGAGLLTAIIGYGSPDLSDNVAPVITATQITLSIKAAAAAALGGFDLIVGSQRFVRYFAITN